MIRLAALAGGLAGRAARSARGGARPDESYFDTWQGRLCLRIHCHGPHTLFNGTFSTAMSLVDLDDPENSLILKKLEDVVTWGRGAI